MCPLSLPKLCRQAAACFIVPQGREHEFVFASQEGLQQIGGSAQCRRLIAVSLEARNGHVFGDMQLVQAELAEAVTPRAITVTSTTQ